MPPKNRKNEDARLRAQARREQMRKQEQRRKLGLYGLWSGVGVVAIVLVVLFLVVFPKGTASATKNLNAPASSTLVSDITTIAPASYTAVGTSLDGSAVTGLTAQTGGTPITTDGKPTFVYIGGEFCPYCAAERWALTTALARFGTFSGLQTTKSSGADVYPDTATLSFLTAKYTSDYIAFTPYEVTDRDRKALQTPDAAALASEQKYDNTGSVPFFSINNVYTGSTQYIPTVLAGKSADQIAAAIKDPTTDISKQVLSAANIITAGICAVTKDQPTAVCSATEVKASAQYLTSGGSTGSSGS